VLGTEPGAAGRIDLDGAGEPERVGIAGAPGIYRSGSNIIGIGPVCAAGLACAAFGQARIRIIAVRWAYLGLVGN
jgi:hypothetical protein